MVGVLFSNVLDTKVVYEEGKNMRLVLCLSQRRGSVYRGSGETEPSEVSFEFVDGDAAGLLEAGHAFSNLEVDPAV